MLKKDKKDYWSKGNMFTYNQKRYQVTDVTVEKFYQTETERVWLKYRDMRDKKNPARWVDSEWVQRVEKKRKK